MNKNNISPDKVLRFSKPEILIHWAVAVPFIVCYATALILAVFYTADPTRGYRDIFSWVHRIAGVAFFALPMLVIIIRIRHIKVFFGNIRESWNWSMKDIKFLFTIWLAAINKNVRLPDQGKFNAAEKINFMVLVSTYPVYIFTGIMIWISQGAMLSWLIHFGMAIMATPLIFGHIFMATINPSTRIALSGMFSGYVDREFVKHHHTLWYKDHFEKSGPSATENAKPSPAFRSGSDARRRLRK